MVFFRLSITKKSLFPPHFGILCVYKKKIDLQYHRDVYSLTFKETQNENPQ